ncbi:MAG: IclR family transcriptional regulator [Candidatus Promineifilaceae bacterium]|jgi:DNA-binding IclR family transcriptional regulator
MSQRIKPYPGTQSVLRAVALLKCFNDDHPQWNLSELSRTLGLNKTTVFRLLSALESENLLSRNAEGDSYVLGPEILVMAGFALRNTDLRTAARPDLERLAESTGETASLEIVTGFEMLIIDEIVGGHLVSGVRSLGTRWPLHGTSTGLSVLAVWPRARRESYLSQDLKPITPQTIIESQALNKLLDHFSEQGFAISDEMLESGLVAIGAPLLNHEGHAEAAISIYGPKNRLDEMRILTVGLQVRDAAKNISQKLGYLP